MRFAFTDEHLLFRDSVRDVLDKRCPPGAVRQAWENESGRVPELWAQLAELGIVGLTVPTEHGGLGLGELDWVLLLEEAGRTALPEPLAETTAVGVPLLCEAGSSALMDRWLGSVAAGEAVIAVGLDDSPYVAHAAQADLLLLAEGSELHAVPAARARLSEQRSVDGSRRIFEVAFDPSAETHIAGGPEAAMLRAAARDRGALSAAAQLLGLADRMLSMTVEYAKVRQQFGRAIGSFQAVKHHLANALMSLEFARPLVYRAAYSLAQCDPERSLHVSMAKAYASDAATRVSRAALQCHGAIGYTQEYDLHLWMKRVWVLAAAWGDAAFHRRRVGQRIFDVRSESRREG